MTRHVALRLTMLGALAPAVPVTPAAVRRAGPAAAEVIRWQKSTALSAARLEDLALRAGDPQLAALHSVVARTADDGRRRVDRLAQVDAHVVALGQARTYPVKGLAFRDWYPEREYRDVGDLDLWVPDPDEAWQLARALRDEGWVYQDEELPWLKRDARGGRLYGQIRMWAGPGDPDIYIDIHYGPFYSVRHCGVLPVRRPERGRTLAPADNLAMMVGNAANDHFITIKDVNDLYLALDRDDVDWERLLAVLRSGGIERFLVHMVDRLRRCVALDERHRHRLATLPLPRRAEFPAPLPTSLSRSRRWLTTVAHAARTARVTPGLPAARTTAAAARHYALPLRLRVVDAVSRPLRIGVADNATCVRLVPREQLAAAGGPLPAAAPEPRPLPGCRTLTVTSLSYGDVVRCGPDTFLPTVDYAVDRRLVAESGRTAGAAPEPVEGEA